MLLALFHSDHVVIQNDGHEHIALARARLDAYLAGVDRRFAAVPLHGEALSGWLLSGLGFVSLGSFVASRYGGSVSRN